MAAAILITALALQSAAPAADATASRSEGIAAIALAEAMERGFRACAEQVAERKLLSTANDGALAKTGLTLSTSPPDEIAMVASTIFRESPLYAEVKSSEGKVWVIASPDVPACKVTAGDSRDVTLARQALDGLFAKSTTWSLDKAQSHVKDGVRRQTYVLNKGKPGPHMIAFIDGPVEIVNDGKGVQAIITVGIQKPEAK
jgi:hypothetical protein